tara:strand:- start:11066 stop:11992 length:927 start_codon:yes stop_codon:yes gene_type:complete
MKNLLFLLIISINFVDAELSFGSIEEIFIANGEHNRKIQIYYPTDVVINEKTKFIIMNDGEELFQEKDSWNGGAWNIDDSFKKLYQDGVNLNIVVIALDSAKRSKGKIIDETRRYVEYFPNEAIEFFEEGIKKNTYSYFIDKKELNYPYFLINTVIPYLEEKFNTQLNQSNLGIIGASMGGLSALNTMLEYPDYFGFAGCISTHWVGIKPSEYLLLPIRRKITGDKETTEAIRKYIDSNVLILNNKRIYFDHGTVGLDSLYGPPQEDINKIFEDNDIDFRSKVFLDHGHETNFFGARFGSLLVYLLEE